VITDQIKRTSPPPVNSAVRSEGFEQCAEAIDQLFHDALKENKGPTAFDEFLQFARRLSDLSMYNAMLVKVQRPGATAVATAKRWAAMGGQLRPSAIPIVILRPFGPVALVYEYSDVFGVSIPGEDASSLFATGDISQKIHTRVIAGARGHRIHVSETDDYGGLLAGTAEALSHLPGVLADSKEGPLWSVKINARHDLATRFATLTHELGHIYCGHLGADPKGRWPGRERKDTSHAQREMEAEAVCWLVCNRNGVSSRSTSYLHSLMEESDLSQVSIYSIFAAANLVEAR
jgi:hypothetical protein